MLFSVIIPVYNAENTLSRCVDSLLEQDEGDIEIILVNDGSTDSSGRICRQYYRDNSCVKYIEKSNGGVSTARNAGLEIATGKFVLFVDSDDYVENGFFREMMQDEDDDFLLIGHTILKHNQQIQRFPHNLTLTAKNYLQFFESMLQNEGGAPWAKRFNREIIERNQISFPEDLSVGEDFVFMLCYLSNCKSAVAKKTCLYIVDEGNQQSLTRGIQKDTVRQALSIYKYAFIAIENAALTDSEKDSIRGILQFNYYRTAFACVKKIIKRDDRITYSDKRKEISEALSAFKHNSAPNNSNQGKLYLLMRCVVDWKLSYLAFLIARHSILKDKRKDN